MLEQEKWSRAKTMCAEDYQLAKQVGKELLDGEIPANTK